MNTEDWLPISVENRNKRGKFMTYTPSVTIMVVLMGVITQRFAKTLSLRNGLSLTTVKYQG
jgi:hypothetical protein